MWCVVGLGNPGPRYRWSRHNTGSQFIDRLCQASGIRTTHRLPLVEWGEGGWSERQVILARPQTFMNRSGLAVRALLKERPCDPQDLIVVHDDLDLELGRLKFKQRGGDGGHKGIHSIMASLERDRFLRLRIGIGRPPRGVDPAAYVLETFVEQERQVMELALNRAVQALSTLFQEGLARAMDLYHAPAGPKTLEVREQLG
jgi:PTH1 family peptidyl-tRNA hydrolase